MPFRTARLKNGELISKGAATAWKKTLVKEGLPLSPLKKSSTKSMTCCSQIGVWLKVTLRPSWASPRNVFMQLFTTILKWQRSQLEECQHFFDLIRSGWGAQLQRTILPFFMLIQKDLSSDLWPWMRLGFTTFRVRPKNNPNTGSIMDLQFQRIPSQWSLQER